MSESKPIKNCFLSFRNRRINEFDGANAVISAFASMGYYFDKVSFIAFDSTEEIVRAVKDGKENYSNIVIYCPASMEKTLKSYISSLYSAEFDRLGILSDENSYVFVLFSDAANRLKYEDIKNALDLRYGVKFDRTFIKTVGAPHENIAVAIERAKEVCEGLIFNVSDRYGDCTIEIIYSHTTPKMSLDGAVRAMLTELQEYVYAMEDVTLAERLFQLLKLRRMKICVAESFTGGGVGKRLVDVPGISEVFYEGLNTYANESKIYRLGVGELTLIQHGAVSEETAYEMAEGLLKKGFCDVAISTTGIAGPKSDNTKKPVGLIYIGVGTAEKISVYKYNLKGDRNNVTETAINLALFLAYKTVK